MVVAVMNRTPQALLLRALSLYPDEWFSAGEYATAINGVRKDSGLRKISRERIMGLLLDWVKTGAVEMQWTEMKRAGVMRQGRVYRAHRRNLLLRLVHGVDKV